MTEGDGNPHRPWRALKHAAGRARIGRHLFEAQPMNDFDQTSRFIAETEPQALVDRLLRESGLSLLFGRWFPTRTIPRLRSPERDADSVAELTDPARPDRHYLMVIEFQGRPEPHKIRVLLE